MKIKKHLRSFVYNLAALWLVEQFFEGVSFVGGYQTLLIAAVALTIINILVKPLIKLLFLPINLITLGAFRWLVNVIALYVVTLLVPQFILRPFDFQGFTYQGFVIPSIHLGVFWVYVLTSFFISLIASFLFWLAK